jgi:hypothetical protein
LFAGPDLIAVVVTPIRHYLQAVGGQDVLGRAGQPGQLAAITADVADLVRDDQVMVSVPS